LTLYVVVLVATQPFFRAVAFGFVAIAHPPVAWLYVQLTLYLRQLLLTL
jgi:hypothetical protein